MKYLNFKNKFENTLCNTWQLERSKLESLPLLRFPRLPLSSPPPAWQLPRRPSSPIWWGSCWRTSTLWWLKQFLVKRPNHAQSDCYSGTRVTDFAIYWSKSSCDGSSGEKSLLKASVTLWLLKLLEKAWWEKATRAQSLNLTLAESAASLSTITNNLLPFHFFIASLCLPLRVAHGNVLNRLQVVKIWPEMVKCVSGLYWLYFMIIYLSYNNACLRERKLTGRKCLKQKWLKKEELFKKSRWEQVRWKQGKD